MSEVAELPVGQASATSDADNISFEGLGELLQEKREKAQQDEPAEVTQEQTDAGATEEPKTESTPEVESPEGPEDQPAEEETDEAEAQDADEAEESAGLDERTQGSVNKRIGKLTAQRKRAEESRQDVEERLGESQAENRKLQEQLDKSGTDRLMASDPLADVMSKRDLKEKAKQCRDWRRWATRNPEGGEFDFPDGSTQDYDSQQVENILKYSDDMLEEHIPSREKWLENNSQMDSLAGQHFPDWGKSSSAVYGEYQDILREMPELKRFPNFKQLVGVFHMGLQAYNGALNASAPKPKAKKVAKPTEPTRVASPASAPPLAAASSRASASVVDAEKWVDDSGGSADAVMELLKARRTASAA
jgi:hypothetical protein